MVLTKYVLHTQRFQYFKRHDVRVFELEQFDTCPEKITCVLISAFAYLPIMQQIRVFVFNSLKIKTFAN